MSIFDDLESEVRYYCRHFPTVFESAANAVLTDTEGRSYLDFLAGAGALNYGHNPPALVAAVMDYLRAGGVVHSLDLHTRAKGDFLERLEDIILAPRGLRYKVQFTGPTGANAVEAALKLARLVTGRTNVVAFTNAFHGMSLGALAATGGRTRRAGAGLPLEQVTRLPYEGYPGGDGLGFLGAALDDPGSGLDLPAAVIVETLQAEGGLNTASPEWLRRLERLCRTHGMLLIVDDIQAGCGRTGPFFSFEPAGLTPDLVCLSKSIGGLGLPLSLLLIRPELDRWRPGQHNGTFRGHNLAFVAGARALEQFWRTPDFQARTEALGERLAARLGELAAAHPGLDPQVRGRGLLRGLRLTPPELAAEVAAAAYRRGLLLETCGPRDEIIKVMPPLTIESELLEVGLDRLADALADTLNPLSAAAQ